MSDATFLHRFYRLLHFNNVHTDRLLEQYVFAGVRGGHNRIPMLSIRVADNHHIDRRIVAQVLVSRMNVCVFG